MDVWAWPAVSCDWLQQLVSSDSRNSGSDACWPPANCNDTLMVQQDQSLVMLLLISFFC